MGLRAAALAIAIALGLAHGAAALVVDSFEVGPFELTSNGTEEELLLAPLDTAAVATGSRFVFLTGVTSAVATLAIGAGDDGLVVDTVDGADLELRYALPGPTLDWTDGGSADRLRITVGEISDPLSIALSVTSTTQFGPEMETTGLEVSAAGVYEVTFASFGFLAPNPFATVVAFSFVASQTVAAPGTSLFAVSDLRTVPEPSRSSLVAIAVLALVARRNKLTKTKLTPGIGSV